MAANSAAAGDSIFYEFPARSYLEKYYCSVGDENSAFLRSILEYLRATGAPTDTVIEVAGGPSLFSLLAIAAERGRPFRHVTFTDIGWKNLREVDCWLRSEPYHFDYQPLLDWLETETGVDPRELVETVRASSWELARHDWHDAAQPNWRRAYDVVSAHFFAESATSDEQELVGFLSNVAELGRPGGAVLLSFMCRSDGYVIAGRDFPAVSIDEQNVFEYLERAGLALTDVSLRTAPTEDPDSMPGYDGMLFIGGRLPGR